MFAVPDNTVALPADRIDAHPVRLATAYARDSERWTGLLRYDPDARVTTLLEESGAYQVWLMTWLPGQHTDLHDHGGASGAFTVVRGALWERVLRDRAGQPVEVSHDLVAGQSRVFGPGYTHQVTGIGAEPAVSIHVYRPLRSMRAVGER
ncbi:MAG: cysteine dioxygenase [Sciscionella sp.]